MAFDPDSIDSLLQDLGGGSGPTDPDGNPVVEEGHQQPSLADEMDVTFPPPTSAPTLPIVPGKQAAAAT